MWVLGNSCLLARAAAGAITLNESFAVLAINVATCIVTHGDKAHSKNQERVRTWLPQLKERYPDAAAAQSSLPVYVPGAGHEGMTNHEKATRSSIDDVVWSLNDARRKIKRGKLSVQDLEELDELLTTVQVFMDARDFKLQI